MAAETTYTRTRWPMPAHFRDYLLGEGREWWRVGKRAMHGAERYTGLRLTVSADQGAGLAPEFVEYLDQRLREQEVAPTLMVAALRYREVREAMDRVARDRPDEIAVLELMAVPAARRSFAQTADMAARLGVGPDHLMRKATAAAALVWDEMGGV